VPLNKKRLRQREFNQSALIARYVAERLGADLILNCLVKIRDTAPQVGLRSKERVMNVRRAFSVNKSDLICNKKLILIDDVVTTGSTIRECAKALKQYGAADVYAISLAHGAND
jgi:ComF family protein